MSEQGKRKILQTVEKDIVDFQTGEVTKQEKSTVYSVPTEPEFIKVYLKDILYLKDLNQSHSSALWAMLQYMNYRNEIVINKAVKTSIATELKTTVRTIENCITNFVKKKLFIRKDRGLYLANPHYFARGKWPEIEKLRLEIEYDLIKGDRDIKAIFKEKESEKPKLEVVK